VTESFGSFARAPRWRAARFSLLALLLVNLAGLNAWAWREQAQINAQRGAIRQVLTSTFPNVRVVVDAPVQMGKEVAALQQASGAASLRDMEVMMAVFAGVAVPGTLPTAIDYGVGELRLKGLRLKPDELASIAFKLKPQAYQVSMEADSLVIKQVVTP
jgi:general secretion pathway protein L